MLNALWPWVFFGMRRIDLALFELAVLWVMILLTCVFHWRVRRLAGALMVPYLLWVSFAGVLNYAIWHLNL